MMRDLLKAINEIILFLVERGLSVEQNVAIARGNQITWDSYQPGIAMAGSLTYSEIYLEVAAARNFTIKLLDGALIQFFYELEGSNVVAQRLAFYPSPYLEDFEGLESDFEEDLLYLEIVDRTLLKTPLRFDFSSSSVPFEEFFHPYSHLHLGQQETCRIPVDGVVCPYAFIRFILASFYTSFFRRNQSGVVLKKSLDLSAGTLTRAESQMLHVSISR